MQPAGRSQARASAASVMFPSEIGVEIKEPPRVDFKVKYRFLTKSEGGRESGPPYNNYRSDWLYDGDDVQKDGLSMVWPFFENSEGEFIRDEIKVPNEGTARMFILVPESRVNIHQQRIKPGVKGYFMEGSRKVAEAEVTEIVDLHANEI